ncbi:MAG: GntR family transcriptional regulator [Protaetiibacter sp.]
MTSSLSAPARRTRDGQLTNTVYERLRSEIIRGVLRPNEALVEALIAERLGVSRTPVRESLQRLSVDGLIVSRRRRWVVYEHTREEVTEIYELRAALESYAARLAASRRTEEQIAEVECLYEETKVHAVHGRERVEANEHFHDAINRMSHNERLFQTILRSRVYGFNDRVAAAYSPEQYAESWAQHGAIVEAVRRGEASLAGELARSHVDYSLEMVLSLY